MTPGDAPVVIADVFAAALADAPDREALVTRSGRYTYRQLDALCSRAASALWALGVRAGDRVAASLPNDTDVVVAFHGAMRLGAVWVGVNRMLAPPEKRYLLDDSDASVYLVEAHDDQDDAAPACDATVVGPDEWRAALDSAGPADLPPVDPDAPAGIAYTSGTTGHPKGAVHGQRGLLAPGTALVASRGYGPDLCKGDSFALTILNMQVLTTLLVAQARGCTVIMDRGDARSVAEWVRRERVTTWNGPPAILHTMVDDDAVTREDLASLEEVWAGGGHCPESLRERFAAKFGKPVIVAYGLSEAPTVVTIDPRHGEHRAGGCGRPLPHLAVRILDDHGDEVPAGEPGEICVAPVLDGPWSGSYRPMLGYLGRPEATAETLAGGVLHTGDIGEVDADGWLYVRDRKNVVIIRGGANVYPAEVERVLGEAPGVAGCAVLGVPDERLGERVAAVVEPSPGATIDEEAVRAHCLEQLARYKVPERLVVVDELPRNAMGKADRAALQSLIAE